MACDKASIAVSTVTTGFTLSVKAGSAKDTAGNISGVLTDCFVPICGLVKTPTFVTSLPVPDVVGTVTIGKGRTYGPVKRAASSSSFVHKRVMTFAASIGEPPPMPMTKSTPSALPSAAALRTVSMEGLFSTSSNKTQAIPNVSRCSVIAFWEPLILAE